MDTTGVDVRSTTSPRAALVVGMALLALTACGFKSGAAAFSDDLKGAGFDSVQVDRDEEKMGKKKQLVAYDFDWVVNTDDDSGTCTVELEHPAKPSGALKGNDWHIDEVNGDDVSGWGDGSPDADDVREMLNDHHYDC